MTPLMRKTQMSVPLFILNKYFRNEDNSYIRCLHSEWIGKPALLFTDTTASAAPVGVADYPSTPIIILYILLRCIC